MKKCFTINQMRTGDEIDSYHSLFIDQRYQGIEIFYPKDQSLMQFNSYTEHIQKLQQFPIEFVMHLPFGPQHDLCQRESFSQTLQYIQDAIVYGQQFGVKKYTLHLGYEHHNREADIKHVIFALRLLCDTAYPSYIMIENMPDEHHIGYSPEEIKTIITQTERRNIKFILDTGHAHLSAYSINDYIDCLEQDLFHLHVHDNNQTRDQHAPIGTGTINFSAILKRLAHYQELYCLEIIYKDVHDLIRNSQDFENCLQK